MNIQEFWAKHKENFDFQMERAVKRHLAWVNVVDGNHHPATIQSIQKHYMYRRNIGEAL